MSNSADIQAVDWTRYRCAQAGISVPQALEALLGAESRREAELAEWELEDNVVPLRQLYEASLPVTELLTSRLCQGRYTPSSLSLILDLLVEITFGEPEWSERERGLTELGPECRSVILRHIDCVKRLVDQVTDDYALLGLLDLVDCLESGPSRQEFLARLPLPGWPPKAIARVADLHARSFYVGLGHVPADF